MMCKRTRIALVAIAVATVASLAGPVSADPPATVAFGSRLGWSLGTVTVYGNATCWGGGEAAVTFNGTMYTLIGGSANASGTPGLQLASPVIVACDGTLHNWQGFAWSPGNILPISAGANGTATVNLIQGPPVNAVLATTGTQPFVVG
ncbi:hypothetical protein [Nocardia sp. NPDC052566]|uniref:hypothetical protein n=1 Tax=Nocardia sp. NPDC052566 TaxID=3364330 RepID=UPI0037C9EABF